MGDGRERSKLENDGGMTSANDPLAGTPYRATRLLGEGGTALVYEARPRAGGRRVAVKALKPSVAASDDAVERMRIEAEALHCLRHPNIVRVLDFGRTPQGYPYLVEERLYGRSLHKEILARGPLPVREAIDFVCQLLTGLEVVHRLGIVHRDLKLGHGRVGPHEGAERMTFWTIRGAMCTGSRFERHLPGGTAPGHQDMRPIAGTRLPTRVASHVSDTESEYWT